MIPFTLSKDISFELPQDYGELTLSQFFAIRKNPEGDTIDLLTILSGLPRKTWEQARDFNIDAKIAPFLVWMQDEFNPEFKLKDYLVIEGKECKRPTDIRTQHFGQKNALEKKYRELSKEGGDDTDLIPFALALYFQPAYFNNDEYDADQVNQLLPLIMNCKIEDAYPIGSFFLNSYAKLLTSKERSFHMFLHRKKLEQALIDSKNLKSSQQYTLFQKVLIKAMTMFYRLTTIRFSLPFGMRKNSQLIKGS